MDYKERVIELVEKIESEDALKKIYTVVKTHFELLNKKGSESRPMKSNQV